MLVRKIVAVLLWLVVLCTIAAEAQMGGSNMGSGGPMGPMGPMERYQYAREMRQGSGMYGLGFMHSAGFLLGEYVNFEIDTDGAVINYSVGGFPVFEKIYFQNFQYEENITTGTVTRVIGDDASKTILIHDNPSGNINLMADTAAEAVFELSDGVTAGEIEGGIMIESDDITAYILSSYYQGTAVTFTREQDTIRVGMPAGGVVVVRTGAVNLPIGSGPYREMWRSANRIMARGVATGRFGCEIAIGNQSTYSPINYRTGITCWADQFDRNRLRIRVQSTDPAGTLVGINFDNRSYNVSDPDRLQVRLNDRLMNRTMDLDRLYNETDRPQCWWLAQDNAVQMLCNIPNFSEQIITIETDGAPEGTPTVTPEATPTPTPTPSPTPIASPSETATPRPTQPGFGVAVAIAGLLAVAYIMKRGL
ncbi:MAG: PGF-CTERM sorting domain-containing protein [Candidatus Methanospirareceae archaeon]